MFVSRTNPKGNRLMMAKCCDSCLKYIHTNLPKKGYKLNKSYYTNEDGEIAFKNVFNIHSTKIRVEGNDYSYSDLEVIKSMGNKKKRFYKFICYCIFSIYQNIGMLGM